MHDNSSSTIWAASVPCAIYNNASGRSIQIWGLHTEDALNLADRNSDG